MLQTFILSKGNSLHHELLPTVFLVYLSLSFETSVLRLGALKCLFNSKIVPRVAPFIVLWLRILRARKLDWDSAVQQNCYSCAQGPSSYWCIILHNMYKLVLWVLQISPTFPALCCGVAAAR